MSLPGSSSAPAVDRRRDDCAFASGRAVVELLRAGIRPRQIMTKEAFENAIAVVMALGGSTNAVLHLLAIANEARVDLALDDFNKVAARVPHLADTKPHGKYHMADLDRIGGVPVVMRELLEAGLLHGDCLTVTGRTWPRTWPPSTRPPPTATWSTALRPDPRPGRHRRPDAGRSPRRARWSRWPASTRSTFDGTARVFDGEDAGHGGDPGRRRSSPAPWWSSATRARRAARACARCWPSPGP